MATKSRISATDRIDRGQVARGASGAFTVLVIGGLSQPLVGHVVPGLGAVWLPVVAIAAFAVAGVRVRASNRPTAHGALAAVCGYVLVLPLVLMATRALNPTQTLFTLFVAVLVGGVSGYVTGRLAARRA